MIATILRGSASLLHADLSLPKILLIAYGALAIAGKLPPSFLSRHSLNMRAPFVMHGAGA